MCLKQGEVYRCPDRTCEAEITVTRGCGPECKGKEKPRCCCGKEMVKK